MRSHAVSARDETLAGFPASKPVSQQLGGRLGLRQVGHVWERVSGFFMCKAIIVHVFLGCLLLVLPLWIWYGGTMSCISAGQPPAVTAMAAAAFHDMDVLEEKGMFRPLSLPALPGFARPGSHRHLDALEDCDLVSADVCEDDVLAASETASSLPRRVVPIVPRLKIFMRQALFAIFRPPIA